MISSEPVLRVAARALHPQRLAMADQATVPFLHIIRVSEVRDARVGGPDSCTALVFVGGSLGNLK